MAAEQGLVEAQFRLGVMFDSGRGVPQSYAEAAHWLWLAADQGEANAQFLLGAMFHKGQGVSQDLVRADMWVNLASSGSQGDASEGSISAREPLAEQMLPDRLAEAQRLADEWKSKTWLKLKAALETQSE